jgi:hypothetical protein
VGWARLIDWHASHPSLLGSTVEYLCTHDEQNQAFFIGQKPQSPLAGARTMETLALGRRLFAQGCSSRVSAPSA